MALLDKTAELSVEVANSDDTTYQWQRNVGASLSQFADIEGTTEAGYAIPNAISEINDAYRVRVTKNDLTITSN